ncbi:MAG: YheC/YheD family protein [Firmicutes bacterium]|nr:YheC/YheD family protein [Bacillota bacterium]
MAAKLVLGILTGEHNARSPYVRSLIKTAKELGVTAFGFTPRAMQDPDARYVDGFDGAKARSLSVQPFPTVVYNRIATRKDEVSAPVKVVKEILRSRNIPYFNQRFFNKREVDQALRRDPETAVLLPETLTEWDVGQMAEMLERHGMLFVKPISGSFGEGICQLTREGGRYRLDVRGPLGVVTRYFAHWRECVDACRAQMGAWPCIIQEGIRLGRYEDRKTDFRVHVHRGRDEQWQVAGIGAKVASDQAITTHVHSGGRVEDGEVVLGSWYGREVEQVRKRLETAAVAVCERLAIELDENLGELGLDMGISTDGRMVLFEANAKPGRAIFAHKALQGAGKVSRHQVFAHAEALQTAVQTTTRRRLGVWQE